MIKRVLLVDDSPIIHKLLTRALERHGYQVCGDAKDGREGVEMYKSLKPDLVFMDITMPIMDGLEAVKHIREINPNVPIIMLSAMGDQEIIGQAKDLGVNIFLKKPFDDSKVINAISSLA
ncbi:MAG TPA: response regulator [Clostridia bacterium]|nr:response regulator [Clostridia bacterium]